MRTQDVFTRLYLKTLIDILQLFGLQREYILRLCLIDDGKKFLQGASMTVTVSLKLCNRSKEI
jgi:hypothetical protein